MNKSNKNNRNIIFMMFISSQLDSQLDSILGHHLEKTVLLKKKKLFTKVFKD